VQLESAGERPPVKPCTAPSALRFRNASRTRRKNTPPQPAHPRRESTAPSRPRRRRPARLPRSSSSHAVGRLVSQVDPGQRVKQGAAGRCSSTATSSNGARIACPRRHAALSPSMPTLAHLCLPPAHAPPHSLLATVAGPRACALWPQSFNVAANHNASSRSTRSEAILRRGRTGSASHLRPASARRVQL
jgi:hypothetical protein